MKTSVISVIAAMSVSQAAALTLNSFPENTFTCHVSQTATASITAAELVAFVTDPAGRYLVEKSASNLASGGVCQKVRHPLYSKTRPGLAEIRYAVDEATDTYWLCSGIGFDVDKTGYGSGCWGN